MKDSGKRRSFEGGAVRDAAEGKPRYTLVPPKAFERWAQWLTAGAAKYDDHNWTLGMPTTVILDSLMRHVEALRRGETDEDHAAAIMCNAAFFMEFEGTKWDDRHDWVRVEKVPLLRFDDITDTGEAHYAHAKRLTATEVGDYTVFNIGWDDPDVYDEERGALWRALLDRRQPPPDSHPVL